MLRRRHLWHRLCCNYHNSSMFSLSTLLQHGKKSAFPQFLRPSGAGTRSALAIPPASGSGNSAGFTLIETLAAGVVILIVLGAVFLASGYCIRSSKTTHDVAVASSAVSERLQQLQQAGWEDVTDSDSYSDQTWTDPVDKSTEFAPGLLKELTQAGSEIRTQGGIETVRISAYRPVASAVPIPTPISITRTATAVTVTSAATNLVDEKMVRIDVRLAWTDSRMGAARSVAVSGVVARK